MTVKVGTGSGSVTIGLAIAVVAADVDVVAVGTRVAGRQPLESPVPVEVVTGEQFRDAGSTETGHALQMLSLSFNFQSSAITDGTDSVCPATPCGMGPGQVLMLVNGKRRHSSAHLHVLNRLAVPRPAAT